MKRLLFFGLFIEYPLLGGAYRFIRAMNTTHPAAGTTFAFGQLFDRSFDVLVTGLLLFHSHSPADPFIAGKGCDVLPGSQRLGIGQKCFFQISRHVVSRAAGKFGYRHIPILPARTVPARNGFMACVRNFTTRIFDMN